MAPVSFGLPLFYFEGHSLNHLLPLRAEQRQRLGQGSAVSGIQCIMQAAVTRQPVWGQAEQ